MKITCQSCQSKYTVSDEKVQGKTVKIKCRKCGATILVNSGGVTTSSGGTSEVMAAPGAEASYLVNVADGDQRSMTIAELVAAYQTSVVNAETYVWADGMADWSPLSQVDAIVAALNSPSEEVAAAAPAPTPVAIAAVEAVASEPEHRAAAKRETNRRAQDLFSAKSEEVVTSSATYTNGSSSMARAAAPLPAPAPGAREENSMLFSLSALTAKAGSSSGGSSPPSAPRATTAKDREDSGIIDLKALAAAASASAPAQPAASALLAGPGLFPLGAPAVSSPIAAPPVVSPSVAPPAKSRTPLFIGGGAVVAIAAIVGAFVFMKGGAPPAPATPASDTPADTTTATTAATTPTATATAASTATDAPADSAAASASAKVAAKTAGPPRGVGGPPKGAAAPAPAPAPKAAEAPAPAPKKSSCGCAAGDLMCAMKCSAGH